MLEYGSVFYLKPKWKGSHEQGFKKMGILVSFPQVLIHNKERDSGAMALFIEHEISCSLFTSQI